MREVPGSIPGAALLHCSQALAIRCIYDRMLGACPVAATETSAMIGWFTGASRHVGMAVECVGQEVEHGMMFAQGQGFSDASARDSQRSPVAQHGAPRRPSHITEPGAGPGGGQLPQSR